MTVTWPPLHPLPQPENVVILQSYYATLKSCNSYRKRVTWFKSQPEAAVVENSGEPSDTRQPHGLAQKQSAEFVRTHPRVLDSMRVALEHRERPGQVYEQHVRDRDSFEIPRNEKQVRSMGQAVRCAATGAGQPVKNIADDLQHVINGVHDNDFIQSVIMNKGRSPAIIAYLPDQIADMRRFCAKDTPESLRTVIVIGIDRTFNLGPCYVTTLVYKNMSVVRTRTDDNPVFVGPVLFHFDAKTDTYVSFFSHLSTVFAVEGMYTECWLLKRWSSDRTKSVPSSMPFITCSTTLVRIALELLKACVTSANCIISQPCGIHIYCAFSCTGSAIAPFKPPKRTNVLCVVVVHFVIGVANYVQ